MNGGNIRLRMTLTNLDFVIVISRQTSEYKPLVQNFQFACRPLVERQIVLL